MTTIPKRADPMVAFTATYDGWSRLVKIEESTNTVAEYAYDGAKRRTVKKCYSGGVLNETRHFYYSGPSKWQVLEERVGASADAERQFLWGQRYVDDLILRDRDTNREGTLDERLYALQDANWNIVAVCDSTGTPSERYVYEPYGTQNFLTPAFELTTASSVDWETLYASYAWDEAGNFFAVRWRLLHAGLGVWLSRDPLGYKSRFSLYEYVGGAPVNVVDPWGLLAFGFPPIFLPKPCPRIGVGLRPPIPGPILGGSEREPRPVGPNPKDFPPDKPFKKPWKCPQTKSDCTVGQLASLTKQVVNSCPGKGVVDIDPCTKIFSSIWTCDSIENLKDKWDKCCDARRKREFRCFRGGDRGHKIQIAQCEYQVSYCYYLLRYWKCSGYNQDPIDWCEIA
jgi:RHS repeat-associated protein